METLQFSVVIPVYNRPEELKDLLNSLLDQEFTAFEVIVLEDGSSILSNVVVEEFKAKLDIQYIVKENTGQGFSRNQGSELAKGEYLVFFDSDCLIPSDYFQVVNEAIKTQNIDAWGGPDKSHSSFTVLQKAIGFSMTSILSTGGIRGKKSHIGKFQPRTFNMGIRKSVFDNLGGFSKTNMGEDIELSSRIVKGGYNSVLLVDAFVYHKRRTSLSQFFKQTFYFGKGRIDNYKNSNSELKLVHFFPLVFILGLLSLPFLFVLNPYLQWIAIGLYSTYFLLTFILSTVENKSLFVGVASVITVIVQLSAYGFGFLSGLISSKNK